MPFGMNTIRSCPFLETPSTTRFSFALFLKVRDKLNPSKASIFTGIKSLPPSFILPEPLFEESLKDIRALPLKYRIYKISPYFMNTPRLMIMASTSMVTNMA